MFSIFKKFKLLCENQNGNVIKVLRIDGGGEYNSNEFQVFCDKEGVLHEITAPYTPHTMVLLRDGTRAL